VDSSNVSKVQLRSAKIPGLGLIADHYWFVIFKADKIDRWEVWQQINAGEVSWGHIHKNLMHYEAGVGNGASRLEHEWHDIEATRLIESIERTPKLYPFQKIYHYWPGPNSNTYIQRILNAAKLDYMLGPTAIGKDYYGLLAVKQLATTYQLSTPIIGIKINLPDRFEFNVLTLVLGINLRPFQLIHPFHRKKHIRRI
jgi:hypothetical protein